MHSRSRAGSRRPAPSAARLRRPSPQARGARRCSPPGARAQNSPSHGRHRPVVAAYARSSNRLRSAHRLEGDGQARAPALLGAAERAADGTGMQLLEPRRRASLLFAETRLASKDRGGCLREEDLSRPRPRTCAVSSVGPKEHLRRSRARVGGGAPLRGAEKRRARGRAPSARTCSDSSQLSERSERSERSEFCDGPRARASQDRRPSGRPPCQARGRLPGRGFAPRDVDLFTRNRTRIAA
jgi:hypothetical protein